MIHTANAVIDEMKGMADEKRRQTLMKFFKTGKGEYGEGDKFLGLRVPQVRGVAKKHHDMERGEIYSLLQSDLHDARLCALLILAAQFDSLCGRRMTDDAEAMEKRDDIVNFYVGNAARANNWDLVDLSAPKIPGRWLVLPSRLTSREKTEVIDRLADSGNLWKERISMVCTWEPLRHGDPSHTLRYAERHLHHPHDLMHKAVGWMLREMGKLAGMEILRSFLESHAATMPRTTLRYAIERMDDDERRRWMYAGRHGQTLPTRLQTNAPGK